jgi:hypothetical protein
MRIKLLAIAALIAGPVLAYMGYQEKQRIAQIEKDGVEVQGVPMSGEMKKGRKGSRSYKLTVDYPDKDGKVVEHEFKVTRSFFESISSGDQITVETVPVKMLPGDPHQALIVGGSDDDRAMFPVGIGAFVLGGAGTAFLFGRKQRA